MPKPTRQAADQTAETQELETLSTQGETQNGTTTESAVSEDAGPGLDETSRVNEVFQELVEKSSKVNYEKVGVNSYDGETLVSLRMSPEAFEAMRGILLTLRTEYQLSL